MPVEILTFQKTVLVMAITKMAFPEIISLSAEYSRPPNYAGLIAPK